MLEFCIKYAEEISAFIALLGTLLMLLRKYLIRPVRSHFENLNQFFDTCRRTQAELELIRREVTANGGKSLKDQVSALQKELHSCGVSLLRQEGLVLAILSASKDGIWSSDAEGRCLWVNDWFSEHTGWMPHELHGNGWKNAIHPDCREEVFAEWTACVSERRSFIMDYSYSVKLTGQPVPVTVRCAPMRRSDDSSVIGYVGFASLRS